MIIYSKLSEIFCIRKKFLVFNLVSRDLKIKYRRSFLGFFWTALHPLALCAIYYMVFKVFLKVEIPHYTSFVLGGVIPWTFFSVSVTEGTETIFGNAPLLTKVPIPPQVFPFVACITNFVTFLLALPIVISLALFSGVTLNSSLFYLPLLCFILFVMAYSLSLILSVAYVYLRDLKHAISLFLQIWFYATPVVYSPDMIPKNYLPILYINPLGLLLVNFHKLFLGESIIVNDVVYSCSWALIFFGLAIWCQDKFAQKTVEFL